MAEGAFSAVVNIDGDFVSLSGIYSSDDVGADIIFSIQSNSDRGFDELLYTDDDFSFIE